MKPLSRRSYFRSWLVGLFSGLLARAKANAAPPLAAVPKTTAPAGDAVSLSAGTADVSTEIWPALKCPPVSTLNYELLGVAETATPEEIERAFWKYYQAQDAREQHEQSHVPLALSGTTIRRDAKITEAFEQQGTDAATDDARTVAETLLARLRLKGDEHARSVLQDNMANLLGLVVSEKGAEQ